MNIFDVLVTITATQWALMGTVLTLGVLSIRHVSVVGQLKRYATMLESRAPSPSDKKIQEISVMCQSLVGLGQHLQKIERRLGELESTNTGLHSDNSGHTPYRQAAVMLDMGADLNDLVNSLEMSQAEAKLFQVLHGDMQNKDVNAPA